MTIVATATAAALALSAAGIDAPNTASGAAPGATPSSSGPASVAPSVQRGPSDLMLSDLYPWQAYAKGISGRSAMMCRVLSNSALADCRVTSESPRNAGFGEALAATSKFWRVSPERVAGRPTDDGRIQISVDWETPR